MNPILAAKLQNGRQNLPFSQEFLQLLLLQVLNCIETVW